MRGKSPNFRIHVSVSDLYIHAILLQEICGPILGILSIAHSLMNVEIGTEAAQFPEKEYINEIFFAVHIYEFIQYKPFLTDQLLACLYTNSCNSRPIILTIFSSLAPISCPELQQLTNPSWHISVPILAAPGQFFTHNAAPG